MALWSALALVINDLTVVGADGSELHLRTQDMVETQFMLAVSCLVVVHALGGRLLRWHSSLTGPQTQSLALNKITSPYVRGLR